MRVHVGSDHAGLELKAHLLAWLGDHGYDAVDHGPFAYDALDDYPVFCLRAAEAAFRRGVAAGTAAVLTPGTELCNPADVDRLEAALPPP